MRNQFVGDIGDFFKFGLLRAIKPGRKLGVAWYLCPDDPKSNHGSKTGYLDKPEIWRDLDPLLFDKLGEIVGGVRSVHSIETSEILPNTMFSSELLECDQGNKGLPTNEWRKGWFLRTSKDLKDCDLIFADPDNTLCEDQVFNYGRKSHWGRMPLSEALRLKNNCPIVIYHHNNREEPHDIQNAKFVEKLGEKTIALRFRDDGSRTFFISNYDYEIEQRILVFYEKWSPIAKITLTQ